jgi:hypothetical protein
VSSLNIAFTSVTVAARSATSLLHAAAGLSPAELQLALLERADVELPPFRRAASIRLHAWSLRLTLPRSGEGFPKLENLSLSGCCVDLGELALLCPCLRVLRVADAYLDAGGINIQSESLEKLVVRTKKNKARALDQQRGPHA